MKTVLSAARGWLVFLTIMLGVLYVSAGCRSTSRQYFEDFGLSGGLSIAKPRGWQAEFDERNETVVVKGQGFRSQDSALIVIQPYTALPASSTLSEHLEASIDTVSTRSNLDPVMIVQEPVAIEHEAYEAATATILVPTTPLPADSKANQVGVQRPDTFQTIVLFAIRCADNFAMIYVYEGNSEKLNAEAESIVKSIELTCSTGP